MPEVSLHPPGAAAIRHGGVDSDNKMGGNPAILADLYATDDTPAAVLDYYRDHLGQEWTADDNAGTRPRDWAKSGAWESDRYVLQVGIVDKAYRSRAASAYPDVAGRRTWFVLQLQVNPRNAS